MTLAMESVHSLTLLLVIGPYYSKGANAGWRCWVPLE